MARPRMSSERSTTSSSSASSRVEQLAELALVELTEALEERDRLGRRRDDDLAPIVRVVVAASSSPSSTSRSASPLADDEPIAEPGSQLGHPQLAGGHDDVQDLGLGHGDADLGELRGMAADQPVHQCVVALDDGIDRGRPWVVCSVSAEMFGDLRTIRTIHTISAVEVGLGRPIRDGAGGGAGQGRTLIVRQVDQLPAWSRDRTRTSYGHTAVST